MNSKIVAVVAHDAGGAELLAHYLLEHQHNCLFVLQGPALNVFSRVLGELELSDLETAISRCDCVLTGTGWGSRLEWEAIRGAQSAKKYCVSYLDHWGNYPDRFERDGRKELPDAIWVADKWASELAKNAFPDTKIELKGNYYLSHIADAAAKSVRDPSVLASGQKILVVTEPVSTHAQQKFGNPDHFGYTEFDTVRFIFQSMNDLLKGLPLGAVTIRPHPSEPEEKYKFIIEEYPDITIVVSRGRDLVQELIEHDIVIGGETMALVAAVAAGKRAISCLPVSGRPLKLPYPEIEIVRKQ